MPSTSRSAPPPGGRSVLRRRRHRRPRLARRHGPGARDPRPRRRALRPDGAQPRLDAGRAPARPRPAGGAAVRALLPGRRRRHPRLPPAGVRGRRRLRPRLRRPGGHRLLHPRAPQGLRDPDGAGRGLQLPLPRHPGGDLPPGLCLQPRRGAAAPAPHGRAPLPRAAAVAEPRVAQRPAVGGMAEGEGAAARAEPARAGAVQPPARHGDGEPRRVARLPRRAAHPRGRAGRGAAAPAARCCAGSTARPSRSRPTSG